MLLRRTPAAALCGLAAVAVLTACSGHGSAGTVPTATPTTLPAASATPAPAASTGSDLLPDLKVQPSATALPDIAVQGLVDSVVGAAPAHAAAAGAAPAGAVAARPETPVRADNARGTSNQLAGLIIVLDPGHNGDNAADPGRLNTLVPAGGFTKPCNTAGAETNAGYPEHAFTWDVANRAAELLRAAGAKVVLTRHSDTGFGPCVDQRAAIANAAHADAVVAIHADGAAAGAYGFHVIAPALAPDHGNQAILADSWALALAVHASFHQVTGESYATYVSGGLTKRSDLAGLNLSRVPAIFIECANMRNATDAGNVTSAAWREKAAAGIVAGITAFLHRS